MPRPPPSLSRGESPIAPPPDVPSPTPVPTGDSARGPGREPKPDRRKKTPEYLKGVKTGSFGFDKATVRAVIERYFRVYEERDALPGLDQAVLVAFYVMAPREEVEAHYPDLQRDLKELDPHLMPVLREEGGETIIVVTRRAEPQKTGTVLPIILFAATLITLTMSGSVAWIGFHGSIDLRLLIDPTYIWLGFLYFALPLLFVFAVQEVARRLMARRYGMALGPSFLVPVPPFVFFPSIGTFGSVQHAREPYADRKALFDMAAVGPFAGFLAALPVVIVGLLLTNAVGLQVPDGGEVLLEVEAPDGTFWTEERPGIFSPFERSVPEDPHRAHNITARFSVDVVERGYGVSPWMASAVGRGETGAPLATTLSYEVFSGGELLASGSEGAAIDPDGVLVLTFAVPDEAERLVVVLEYEVPARTTHPLAEPLAFKWIAHFFVDDDLVLHPLGLAGWTALFVIGVTLIPAGRLDGGGVSRALFGDRMVIVGYIAVGILAILVFFYPGWLYLVLFIILFLGVRHPAALNETVALDGRRRLLALLLLALFVVCFVPIPTTIAGGF